MSIADKKIQFGGAGREGSGNPWGVMGEITARALAPYGYDLNIVGAAWGTNNPRFVTERKVDFGATRLVSIRNAYNGRGPFEKDGPHKDLRVIACIAHPGWYAVAVKWETGITDLGQIKERKLPLRIYHPGHDSVRSTIWGYYGMSQEMIESWGGRFIESATANPIPGVPSIRAEWARSGNFDVIIDNIYTSYTPEIRHWHEASILYNLRFLTLPDDLIATVSQEIGGQPGFIPHNLFRGIEKNIPAPQRGHQAYYGRADMPDDFVYLLAKAFDENKHLFRQVHLALSYDPAVVADTGGLPLHPAAEQYYREKGYLK